MKENQRIKVLQSNGWKPISEAPKSYVETVEVNTVEGVRKREYFRFIKILTIGNDGEMRMSYWIPEYERWNMYTKDNPPVLFYPIELPVIEVINDSD